MAKFMVKKSELKNICKAVDDRKLAELKKEIIEILKKQDEKDFKKAVDYLESQELHYTHLEKSFTGKWVEKAGYGIGTVRIWKGRKYKKIAPGKWARVFEKEGRGTNIAIGKLIAKVQKIDNVEDLMAFVMANKQRFVDENGIDLPVLDKLRAAVDKKNNGSVGSKEISKPEEKKKESKEDLEVALKEVEDAIDNAGDYDDIEELEKERKQLLKKLGKKPAENPGKKEESEAEKHQNRNEAIKGDQNVRKFGADWEEKRKEIQSKLSANLDKMLEGHDKAKDVYEKLQSNLDKTKADAELYRKYLGNQEEPEDVKDFRKWCDDVIEQYRKEVTNTPSKEIISKWEETARNTPTEKLEEVYNGKQKVDYSNEYENFIDSTIINTFAKDKDLIFPQPYTMLKDIATRKFDNSDKIRLEVIKKELDARKNGTKAEFEKTKNRSDAMKGNKNAYKGKSDEELVKIRESYQALGKRSPYFKDMSREEYESSLDEMYEEIDKRNLRKIDSDSFKKKETPKSKRSNVKVFADKEPVGTFTKTGDNTVEMPAAKETVALFDSLKKSVSKDDTRPFMTDCYYDGENIISTDGRRLVCIKAGNIGLDEGFVKVKTENGKVKIEKFEKDFGVSLVKQFPNYKRVMPDKNEQQVSLDSKRLKEKLKEMKKDGAYDATGRVALEFKDGKVILDGTTVGQSDAKLDGFDFIMLNAEQLTDAIINNDGQTMFISDNPMKPISISDGNSDIVIMPMYHEGYLPDYDENRAKKNAEREAKSEKKAAMKKKNQDYMADLINRYKRSVPANFEERSIKNIQEWSTEQLERMYKVANADIDSLMEKKEFNSNAFSSFTNKNYDMSPERLIQQNYAMKEHPAIVRELERLIKEKGGKIEKSLFDGFLFESLIEEDDDKMEEESEDESLFNDYSAEQPELFNSTEFKVREAFERCKCL